jgi:hypothetical protein
MTITLDRQPVFQPHRDPVHALLERGGLLEATDPTAELGWRIGDGFGITIGKHAIFGKIIAYCPLGISLFGIKRHVYAAETYGTKPSSSRWLIVFLSPKDLLIYIPATKQMKRTSTVSRVQTFLYQAEQHGDTKLMLYLGQLFPEEHQQQTMRTGHKILKRC